MIQTTRSLQERLKRLGHDPGPLDGIRGRRTIAAIRAFQIATGLKPDGVVGPATRAALFASADAPDHPWPDHPWYEEARRLVGTRETPGPASNPAILAWADDLDTAYSSDDVPWCGLFLAHCLQATLPDEPVPGGFLAARSWLGFGRPCKPTGACILVFHRGAPKGWTGHVGFHAGEDADAYHVLGGNQSNAVTVARIAKTRLIGARWPSTVPLGAVKSAALAPRTSALSRNEA